MKKTRILLIDNNESLCSMLREYFSSHACIEISLNANNGEDGLNLIVNNVNDYDLILMDLILPKRDGLYLLNKIREENINKKVIVITAFNDSNTIRKVSEYGVNYFILKPFELVDLEKRIESLALESSKGKPLDILYNNLQISVSKILHELGIPSHIKGYQYIRESIILVYNNPDLVGAITKELYPEVANIFDTTVSRVERAIRHAIEVSWNRGNWDLMEDIFGHSVDIDKAKPTNSEFIVTISDKLRLEYRNKAMVK